MSVPHTRGCQYRSNDEDRLDDLEVLAISEACPSAWRGTLFVQDG